MDDEQPQTGSSGSLSIVRGVGVLNAFFVVAVAVLVSVGDVAQREQYAHHHDADHRGGRGRREHHHDGRLQLLRR